MSPNRHFSRNIFSPDMEGTPFYNWVQYIVSDLFGISVATLTVVKNGLLFLACIFYGLAARTIIADRALSMIAMLGMLTMLAE